MGSLARSGSFEIVRWGCFAWDLPLEISRLKSLARDLSLSIFRLASFVRNALVGGIVSLTSFTQDLGL